MTFSVFSVPYNSSTFDVGVIERWIVIIGGKLCHFRSSPVGKATSRSGVTYHSKSDQHSQVCYPPLSCRMRFFISRRFLKNRGYACKLFMCLSVFWGRTCGPSPLLYASLFSVVINTIGQSYDWCQTHLIGKHLNLVNFSRSWRISQGV